MIAFLTLALTAGIVLGGYALFRRWLVERRAAGALLQELVRPAAAEVQLWAAGLVAVVCLMVILLADPHQLRSVWMVVVALFGLAVFEVACWASGVYQYGFYERGLWYGRSWYPYRDLQSYEIDRDRVRLVARGRVLRFRTLGSLVVEVRLKLAVDDLS